MLREQNYFVKTNQLHTWKVQFVHRSARGRVEFPAYLAADSTSNNLVEADDAVSDADFLNKMGTALKEAKESRTALIKIRLGSLNNYAKTARLELESEATQLSAIFATIIRNMEARLEREKEQRRRSRSRRPDETET